MNNPYPGLRPFNYEESYLFFGREGQSEDLLRKLEKSHFVGVVGTSGSGKSSLVRAGLLPLLNSGFMPNTKNDWRVAVFRPGEDPIHNLAEALVNPGYSDEGQLDDPLKVGIAETILRRSSIGLPDYVNSEDFGKDENLLVVVDQFEELFRFKRESKLDKPDEEAAAFVKLLLEATKDKSGRIFVVITMRSDFLGDCSQFRDLPEAINDGQYLIPRLTRDELRQVIESPAKVQGANISPALVTYLLNEVGDDQDQLPILQHALMRTWDHWESAGNPDVEIGFDDYRATGGMKEALSVHADEAFDELSDKQKEIAEKLFKCITEIDRENRETRRATSLERICEIADASPDEVIEVIDTFRQPGRTFLMPPHKVSLNKDSLIDISHESLIRKWRKLHDWVDEEAESAQTYRRLAEDALLHSKGKAGFWSEPGLSNAVEWRESFNPNEDWAGIYYRTWGTRKLSGYSETMAYLDESKKFRDDEIAEEKRLRNRKVRRLTAYIGIMAFMSIVLIGLVGFAYYKQQEAITASEETSEANAKVTAALVTGYIENGRQELNKGFPFRAAVFLGEAYRMSGTDENARVPENLRFLLGQSMKSVDLLRFSLDHNDDVFSAEFSHDSTKVVTASDDDTAYIWDVQTGKDVELEHEDDVVSASFSPDDSKVVTASDDNTAKIWDAKTGALLTTLKHEDPVVSAKFSLDSEQVITACSNKTAKIWKQNGEFIKDTDYDQAVSRKSSTTKLKIDNESNTVSVPNTKKYFIGHRDDVNSAEFSPDTTMIVTTSRDKTAKVWDAVTGMPVSSLEHQDNVRFGKFSPDSNFVVTISDDNSAKIWSVGRKKMFANPQDQDDFEAARRYSLDGKKVVSIVDKKATVWDSGTGRIIKSLEYENAVNSIEFSPDGKKIVTTSNEEKQARVWETETGDVVSLKDTVAVDSAIFSPDNVHVVTVAGKKATVWNSQNGSVVTFFKEHSGPIKSTQISPDGSKVVTTSVSPKEVKVWDAKHGKEFSLWKDTEGVRSVEFSPNNWMKIATRGDDDSIGILDNNLAQIVSEFGQLDNVDSAKFSPDGAKVVTVWGKTATVWDLETPKLKNKSVNDRSVNENVMASLEHENKIESAEFSPEYGMLVTTEDSKIVKIWDIEMGKVLISLKHRDKVSSAKFSLDSTKIMTTDEWNTVKIWDLGRETRPPDKIAEIIRKNVPLQLEAGQLVPFDAKDLPPTDEMSYLIATPHLTILLLLLGMAVFLIIVLGFVWKTIRRKSATTD